jgi:hypothetical protein
MDIAFGTKIVFFVYKHLPLLEKIYLTVRPQELNGLWCSCWKYDPNKESCQVGTMVVKQFNKKVHIEVYSAGRLWNIYGLFQNDRIIGTYGRNTTVSLRFADYGRNRNVLKGTYSGPVDQQHPITRELIRSHEENLDFFASRKGYVNYSCQLKQFQNGEGICLSYS